MRTLILLWIFLLSSTIVPSAFADDGSVETRMRKLEQRLQELEQHNRQLQRSHSPEAEAPEPAPSPDSSGPPTGTILPDIARDSRQKKQAPLSFSTAGSGTMIYAKPFVTAPKAFVGGYFDLQYRNHRKDVIDNGAGSPQHPQGSHPGHHRVDAGCLHRNSVCRRAHRGPQLRCLQSQGNSRTHRAQSGDPRGGGCPCTAHHSVQSRKNHEGACEFSRSFIRTGSSTNQEYRGG